MYYLEKGKDLDLNYLAQVLLQFQTKELPQFNKYRKYYDGKQKILQKQIVEGKPCNRVIVNYCYNITQSYQGYITGIPITYESEDFENILKVLNYNDTPTEDSEYLKNALIYGRAFEVNYIDEEGKQRFRLFDTRECVPIYENTLECPLLYVVRFYWENVVTKTNYIVEVYGPNDIKTYRSEPGFASFNLIKEEPHYFGQCPVTVFKLNEDEEPIYKQIIPIQDAYNNIVSDQVDDEDSFADAYLVLKGVTAESEDLANMKRNRALLLDVDADASYLTKNISDGHTENMLQNLNDKMFMITGAPDFMSENFMAQSGIALRYKLVGFENKAASIEQQMKKALQRRLELIQAIFNITDDEPWRDVDIRFTRNLPVSLTPSSVEELMQYKGLVSDKTLLSLVPFVKDPDEEMALKDEENNLELFKVEEDEDNGLLETESSERSTSN